MTKKQSEQTSNDQVNLLAATATTGGVPAGTVVAFFGNSQSIPAGWFLCNGRQLSQDEINKHPTLANLLANYNYCLPNLNGRTIIGSGSLTETDVNDPSKTKDVTYEVAQNGGASQHKISTEEMPSHNHFGWGEAFNTPNQYNWGGNLGFSTNRNYIGGHNGDSDNYLYGSTYAGGKYEDNNTMSTSTGSTGMSKVDHLAYNNMPPYYVLNYMICAG